MPVIPAISPARLPPEWLDAGADSLLPSEMDAPPAPPVAMLRGPRSGRALIAIGTAACVGLLWLVVSSIASTPDAMADLPPASPIAAPSPAPAALAPAAVNATASSEATGTVVANNTAPGFADSFKAALEHTKPMLADTPATIPVTVRISPSDAFVFKSERRVGRGNVTVNVAPGTKVTLVAQRDGYLPRTLVLDGRYNSVNIALKRAAASRVTTSAAARPTK